jgi:hypothetical protein
MDTWTIGSDFYLTQEQVDMWVDEKSTGINGDGGCTGTG